MLLSSLIWTIVVQYGVNACSEKLQYEMQKCINFSAKVASNGKYLKRDHVTPLLRDLNWINFNIILQLNETSFMYKNLYVSTDSNVKMINFDLWNKVSLRITRNGSDVHIDYRRTAVGQKAVSVSGAKLWNSITMNIRNSNTIVTFVQNSYVPTPLREPITILEQTQTFLIKHSTFVSFFKMWMNSIYLKSMLIKNLNHILNHGI